MSDSNREFQSSKTAAGVSTSVGTSLTELLLLALHWQGRGVVNADILNLGVTNDFSGCEVHLQNHPDAAFYRFIGSGDWGVDGIRVLFCDSDPSILAAGAIARVHFRINAAYAVKFFAKVASGTTDGQVLAKAGF